MLAHRACMTGSCSAAAASFHMCMLLLSKVVNPSRLALHWFNSSCFLTESCPGKPTQNSARGHECAGHCDSNVSFCRQVRRVRAFASAGSLGVAVFVFTTPIRLISLSSGHAISDERKRCRSPGKDRRRQWRIQAVQQPHSRWMGLILVPPST